MAGRRRLGLVALAVVVSTLCLGITGWAIQHFVNSLFDPCAQWGHVSDGHAELSLPPGGRPGCAGIVGYDSPLVEGTRIVLVPGGVFVAAVFAVLGAIWARQRIVLTGAILMGLETLVIFTMAPLTAIAAGAYFWIAARLPRPAVRPAP